MQSRWFLLFLTLFACTAAAQQPAAPGATGAAVSPSNLTFDVQVTDKAGHPVLGLQQSDFTLLDNKHPSQILSFQEINNTASPSAPANQPLVILVMDELNPASPRFAAAGTGFAAVSYEQKQIGAFLTQNGGHLKFPVVLVSFSLANLQQIGKATTDGNALNALLLQQKPELHALNSAGDYSASEEMQRSIQVLQSLATIEARVPGRKLLVWVSPGWADVT